jgi:arylsulfatase A-like enzyme/Flp pilus assembly protein TadD
MTHRRPSRGGPRSAATFFLIAIAVVAGACRRDDSRAIGADKSPVIIITIDTLRSDHLPAYGYSKVATPAIDEFRRDAILYERAYTQCPLTLVAHASLFTGLLPAEHGIRDNAGYEMNKGVKTLAEIMKSKGYATGGAVSAIVLRSETGIKRGFDFWDDDIGIDPNFLSMGRAQRNGDETREIAEKWIDSHGSNPFFFFFHIYEPHTPYDPPEPLKSQYGSSYDGDVAAADAVMGRFFAHLKDQGLYDKSTIILLSDHGEGLGDHGEDEHGVLLYRETLQVPLMIKLPKSKGHGRSVSTPVQLIDVLPTITQSLGIDGKHRGQSLLATIPEDRQIYSETFYPRFHFGWSDLHSLISGNNHYIKAPHPELFDLAADPGEKNNVYEQNRRVYVALRDAIAPYLKQAEAPKPVSDEQAKQLAALGYVGSTVATTAGEELPDPKEKIGSTGRIKAAFLAFQEKRYDDAAARCRELLSENPKMLDIWGMYAQALTRLGRYDEAVDAAREGLKISPSSSNLALLIANVSLQQQQTDIAEKHIKLIAEDVPGEAHNLMAQVWLQRKNYPKAEAEAKQVAQGRNRPFGLMLLGRVALEQGRYEDALRNLNEAATENETKKHPPLPKLNFHRGDALARLGRLEEAEAAFRKEIEAYPSDPQAYKNLVLLYVTEGKNQQATQLIFALEHASPTPPTYVAISETLKIVGDRNGARFWAARGLNKYPADRNLQALVRG